MLRTAEFCFGGLIAMFLLVGRWSPYRLQGILHVSFWYEPRFYLTFAIVIVALIIMGLRAGGSVPPVIQRFVVWICVLVQLILLYMIASSLWAPVPEIAIYKSYELILCCIVITAVAVVLPRLHPEGFRQGFWIAIVAICLFLAVVSVVGQLHAARLSALGGGPNAFGRMMALLCLGCMVIGSQRRRVWVWFWFGVWILGMMLLVLSGSRGALLAGAMAVGVAFLLLRTTVPKKAVVLVSCGILAVFVLNVTEIGQRTIHQFQSRVVSLTFERGHASGRELLFEQAVDIGRDNPILGVGIGGFRAEIGSPYPHNFFLELFAEGGAVAVLFAMALMLVLVYFLWRLRRCPDPGMVGALVLFFLFAQFSGDLFDSRGIFLTAMIAMLPRYDPVPRDTPALSAVHVETGAPHVAANKPAWR
ncbi:O-antigen ligase family protein [Phycisphaerales bacterium AB-hyl4]|uniref:O-antigen ligase family protein n=1 Tax=Natronomicrosphaera hydrolytica TaxID=3242702 RepID=A0ABV4U5P3_9BACT